MPFPPVVRMFRRSAAASADARHPAWWVGVAALALLLCIAALWPAQAMAQVRLSLDDAVSVEGDVLRYVARLDAAAGPQGVSMTVRTVDGTAQAGVDYRPLPPTSLTIPPGQREVAFFVLAFTDALSEGDEVFHVDIDGVTGAAPGNLRAQGTITDVPAFRPQIRINDVEVAEGDAGFTPMVFSVSLSAPAAQTVSVDYDASGSPDAVGRIGRLIFLPGQTDKTITVQVVGDTVPEPDEDEVVYLFDAVNAEIAKGLGRGTIINDDADLVFGVGGPAQAVAGSPYSGTISVAYGQDPYRFAVTAGALPPGLQMTDGIDDTETVISGVPTQVGVYRFTITATDSSPRPGGPFSASAEFTIEVTPADPIQLASEPAALAGMQFAPFSGRVVATGGVPPYRFSLLTGGRLPDGLTLDADGTLSGTPTEHGSFSFTVSATDHVPGTPQTARREFAMVIAPAPLALMPATLPPGYLDEPYSQALTVLGGLPPYAFRLSAGTLPPGLQLLAGGAVQGTPTVAGQYRFSLTASDTAQPVPSETTVEYVVDIVARPLQLDSNTLAPIDGGEAFLTVFSARGGTAPYGFTVASGALPPGLDLASDGTLQGVPSAIGSYGFDVQVADAAGATATRPFRLDVVLPVVTIDTALPAGVVDAPYSRSVDASGGVQPYTFSVTAGALPPGLQLAPGGLVQGVPVAAGDYTFTLTVADSNASVGPITASRTYTVRIEPSGFLFGPDRLPNAQTDVLYRQFFSVLYGTPPYEYAVSAGTLPPGLYLFNDMLYGIPSAAGSYAFSITASDGNPDGPLSHTRHYVLVVEQTALEIDPKTLPQATAGRHYDQLITARGGVPPYRYGLASGALPPGVVLQEDGILRGIPTATGHFAFALQVADSVGGTAMRESAFTVVPPVVGISNDRLEPAAVGTNYKDSMSGNGGKAPYTYALTAGTLPAGLEFTANGYLQGIPEATGSFEITITATDSSVGYGPVSGSRSFTLVIQPRRLGYLPTFLPRAVENTPYSAKLEGTNGVAPYRFAITNGALPPGLSLAPDGTISGIPGRPPGSGSFYQYRFALGITDAQGVSATYVNVEIMVSRAVLGISPATVPDGIVGVTAYNLPFTAVNATAPAVISWVSGTLPDGLRFDMATATLSGIPFESGQFPFQLRLTDAENRSIVRSYTLRIVSPTLSLAPGETLPGGIAGTPYAQTFAASGGSAPYRYAVIDAGISPLPPGTSLGEDGVLQGTPTSAGAFTFDIVATDSAAGQGASIRRTYTLTVAPPSIMVDPDTLPKIVAGVDYAHTLGARGGTAPYGFSITAGALPPGLALSAAGVLSGTPTGGDGSDFAVTVTDALGFTGVRNYTLAASVPKPAPASRVMAVAGGRTFTVDLTESASGGPFTAATLISLSPAEAGAAKIVRAGGSHRLEFTPGHDFSGRAVATFTLSNASATSAPATVAFDVAPRPDPSRDAEADRLLDAQTQAAQRFANAQTSNFQQRMERMHGAGEGRGFSNGLSAASQEHCPRQVGVMPGQRCARPVDANAAQRARGGDGNAAFGVWASGMIRSGNQDGRNGDASIDFETDGISVGADYRLNDAFAFGGGLGYGRDESDIGERGSRGEADAFTLALYASYSPGQRGFVDMLLGYQSLGYDLRRHVVADDSIVVGSRDGAQWFGSVSTGADIQRGHWQFTPYARLDVARATLDGYVESGDPLHALAYGELDADTTTGNAGLRIDYRRETDWGAFSPQLRVEYQRDFKGNGAQTMRYADAPSGPFYRMRAGDFDRSRLMLGAGLSFSADNDWSFKFDYRGLIGSGGDRDHGLQFEIGKRY